MKHLISILLIIVILPFSGFCQDESRIEDAEMGFSFSVPEGWQSSKKEDSYILGSPKANGFILVKTENLHSIKEVKTAMEGGIELEDGTKLMPVEKLNMLGKQGVSGLFRGVIDDVEMTGYLMALMSITKQKTVLCISVSPTPNFNQSNLDYVKIVIRSVIFD